MGQRKHGRSGLQGQAGDGGAVQGRLCCTGDNVQCGFAAGRENLFRRTPRAGTAPRRPECPGRVLRTAVVFFYLSNEGVSLLENASHLGLPVPEKIKEVLEQLHDRSEKGE